MPVEGAGERRNYTEGDLSAQGRPDRTCLIRQPEAIIEPRKTLESIGLAALAEHLPVNLTGYPIRVIHFPDVPGFESNPRCAHNAGVFEASEGCFMVAVRFGNAVRETASVFDRHAGALGQRLQGRVRRVPQQNHPSFVPMPDRVAVADRLTPIQIEHRQKRLHGRMRIAIGVFKPPHGTPQPRRARNALIAGTLPRC